MLDRWRGVPLARATSIALLLGWWSATASALFGWWLAAEGNYDANNLWWHRWWGVSTGVVAFAAWLLQSGRVRVAPVVTDAVLVATVVVLTVAGHFGGNLTHGEGFLFATEAERESRALPAAPDSVVVFAHLIQPMLEDNCVRCHEPKNKKGGLLMHTAADLLAGGSSGRTIQTGKPYASELLRRVQLERPHQKAMPPGGPLPYHDVQLLEWWIATGADTAATLADQIPIDPAVEHLLRVRYGLDVAPKPLVETLTAPPLDAQVLENLAASTWNVRRLSEVGSLVEVRTRDPKPDFAELNPVASNVTHLNLSNAILEGISSVGQFSNLTQLNVSNTTITDRMVSELSAHPHLQVLNLYGTPVTDAILTDLTTLPRLERVYLAETNVTEAAVLAFAEQHDRPELIRGVPTW